MKNDKDTQKYQKDELIQDISENSCVNAPVVELVMEALEDVVISKLKTANFDKDVSIKLFNGFYIDGIYIPNRRQKNNLTGKVIDVASKIRVKPRVTRGYTNIINK